jgi:hypothetical protein
MDASYHERESPAFRDFARGGEPLLATARAYPCYAGAGQTSTCSAGSSSRTGPPSQTAGG